jgi:hypothetical protein
MATRAFLAALTVVLMCRGALAQNGAANFQGIIARGPHAPPAYQASYSSPSSYQSRRPAQHAYVPRSFDSPGCVQNRAMQYAQDFYNKRALHDEYVAQHQTPRPTTEQLAVQAKRYAPERLDADEIKTARQIDWPIALRDSSFDHERAQIEQAITLDDHNELRRWIANAQERLISQARQIDPDRFIAAKKFLLGFRYGS